MVVGCYRLKQCLVTSGICVCYFLPTSNRQEKNNSANLLLGAVKITEAMDKLPMVTVEFKSMPSFRCLLFEWKELGGYKGFLKAYGISFKDIKKVRTQVLNASEYPTQAWEG